MRAISTDERDSAWERTDARYRVYVFDGPDNAVTTVDLVETTLDEALDAARDLSGRDERLWSLALVETDARGLRGLVWLSGMDYNDPPDSAMERAQRARMQNRYLAERRRRGSALHLPNGRRLIRMFPEWTEGWPLWESFSDHYHLTPADLTLSPALGEELRGWNEVWSARGLDAPVPTGWYDEGIRLLGLLREELDDVAEVRAEFLHDPA